MTEREERIHKIVTAIEALIQAKIERASEYARNPESRWASDFTDINQTREHLSDILQECL